MKSTGKARVVKRTEHFTECSGMVTPEPGQPAVRFDGERLHGIVSQAKAARMLKRRMRAPVLVEKVEHGDMVYTMPLTEFKRLALVEITYK